MTRPFVEIEDGHRLYVRDWGSGRSILFLAGWGMDSSAWGSVMALLAEGGYRTVAYDRRGHGRSTDPGHADYDVLARDLASVIDALDFTDVTIVAHSGAAGEAIRYCARSGGGRVDQLVFVGATGPRMLASSDAPGLPGEALDAVLTQLRGDLAGWIEENAEPFAPGADRRTIDGIANTMTNCSRRILLDFQRAIAETDLTAEAAALDLPVLLIHGDQDASAPIDLTAREYARIIPGAELLVYEGVAHGVMVTHAARLAKDIAARMNR